MRAAAKTAAFSNLISGCTAFFINLSILHQSHRDTLKAVNSPEQKAARSASE
jgi:hypothetical protein